MQLKLSVSSSPHTHWCGCDRSIALGCLENLCFENCLWFLLSSTYRLVAKNIPFTIDINCMKYMCWRSSKRFLLLKLSVFLILNVSFR